MSERRIGNRRTDLDFANVTYDGFVIQTNDELLVKQNCLRTSSNVANFVGKEYLPGSNIIGGAGRPVQSRPGERWADGRPYYAGFNTIISPNGPSCAQAEGDWFPGVYTATSRHPGIVMVLMGDGSARKMPNEVDFTVWLALGTRDGNENVQLPQ